MTPRELVKDHLLQKLKTVEGVRTVEHFERPARELNISDCPAVRIIPSAVDTIERETFGGGSNNVFHRIMPFDLAISIREPELKATIDEEGEYFIDLIQACLEDNRSDDTGRTPRDIVIRQIETNNFQRMQNGFVEIVMRIDCYYMRS